MAEDYVSTHISKIVINKVTQAQYDAMTERDPNQFYCITDGAVILKNKLKLVNAAGTEVEFDGSIEQDLTDGVWYAVRAKDFVAGGTIESELNSKATNIALTSHTSNADIHVTTENKTTWNNKQDRLTNENAGPGIKISRELTTDKVIIENTNTSAEWGLITGDIADQTDLVAELAKKQDNLTAGHGININDNVITTVDAVVDSNSSGTVKLYSLTSGKNTDGALTQKAVSDALDDASDALDEEIARATQAEQDLDDAKADKATTLAGYGITDAYTRTQIDSKLAGAYHVRPGVQHLADLPLTENEQGDCRNVRDDGSNYVWTSTEKTGTLEDWDRLSGIVDLSAYRPYAEQDAIDATLATKVEVAELEGRVEVNETAISTINASDPMNSGINSTKVASYDAHLADSVIHVTQADKDNWNAKEGALPSKTGHALEFLMVSEDEESVQWSEVDALPPQEDQNGKYLKTNGTEASWNQLATVAETGSFNDLLNKPVIDSTLVADSTNAVQSKVIQANFMPKYTIGSGLEVVENTLKAVDAVKFVASFEESDFDAENKIVIPATLHKCGVTPEVHVYIKTEDGYSLDNYYVDETTHLFGMLYKCSIKSNVEGNGDVVLRANRLFKGTICITPSAQDMNLAAPALSSLL